LDFGRFTRDEALDFGLRFTVNVAAGQPIESIAPDIGKEIG
jgi:hypothetical protein